jgi:hypothetical protein
MDILSDICISSHDEEGKPAWPERELFKDEVRVLGLPEILVDRHPVLVHVLVGEPDSTPRVKPEDMLRRDIRYPPRSQTSISPGLLLSQAK